MPLFRRLIPALVFSAAAFFAMPAQTPPVYTGPPSDVRTPGTILIAGDPQLVSGWEFWRRNNRKAVEAAMERMAGEHPALLVLLGDLVFEGNSDRLWNIFDELAAPLRREQTPVLPIPGNHEYLGNDAEAMLRWYARFPQCGHRSWHSARVGAVGLILLNSNFDNLTDAERGEQAAWYRNTLKNYHDDPSIHSIIVCCHQPPYANSTVYTGSKEVRQELVPAFMDEPKAKLFMSGHVHSYERFMDGTKAFIVTGGLGPKHKLASRPRKLPPDDVVHGGRLRSYHYCRVTEEGGGLRLQMVAVDDALKTWKVEDEIVLP